MLRRGSTVAAQKIADHFRVLTQPKGETVLARQIFEKEPASCPVVANWLMKSWQGQSHSIHNTPISSIQSTGEPPEQESTSAAGPSSEQAAAEGENDSQDPYANLNLENLRKLMIERDQSLSASLAQVEETTDLLKRSLADMENLRQRSARQAEQTKKFAVQGFLKSMLDVGDNLERAFEAVPQDALKGVAQDGQPLTAEGAVQVLSGLMNGVRLTERIFDQGLKANGVEKIKPLGEKFDPNLHDALFEIPDASKEAGTVGAVTKTGYLLQGRVVRPAQVGVYRKP